MQFGVQLITRTPICAVALQPGMNTGREIVQITEGSIVNTLGESENTGMMVIEWKGQRYAMFTSDLDERCAPLVHKRK